VPFLAASSEVHTAIAECQPVRLEPIIFTVTPALFHAKVLVAACLVLGNKTLLDSLQRCVLDKRASGLVRFSYKLSIFRIGGVVICGLEAAHV
jgi:hypothetical protein